MFNVSACQYGKIGIQISTMKKKSQFNVSNVNFGFPFENIAIDSPILLSFPHFYMGDQTLRLAVDGISPPEKEKHQFFIDVQPVCIHRNC